MGNNYYDKIAKKSDGYGYGNSKKLSIKDKTTLQKYINEFTSDKGIQLSRHRLVMVVQKVD